VHIIIFTLVVLDLKKFLYNKIQLTRKREKREILKKLYKILLL